MKKRRSKDDDKTLGDEKPSSRISFEDFFAKCVLSGKLKAYQHKEIETFFMTDNRLKRKEDLDTYQKTLEKY